MIDEFRSAFEAAGVATDGWFDRQLRLALFGAVVPFGGEKAFGDEDEVGWWCYRVGEGLGLL